MGYVANIFKESVIKPETGNHMLFGDRVEEKYFCNGCDSAQYHSLLSQLLCLQRTDPLYKNIKIGNIMVDHQVITIEELNIILEDSER